MPVALIIAVATAGPQLASHQPGPGEEFSANLPHAGGDFVVRFIESGLTAGTSWSVTYADVVNTSVGSEMNFTEPNGTYAFQVHQVPGYMAVPAAGNLSVDGSPIAETISFSALLPSEYNVTFEEFGLPAGKLWEVKVGDQALGSANEFINTTELNGTYSFTVSNVTGYASNRTQGSFTVLGEPVLIEIKLSPVGPPPGTYVLTFSESGLPSGTNWQVTVDTTTRSSTNETIAFSEKNGTYSYTVTNTSGYNATPFASTVTISGVSQGVSVIFAPYVPGSGDTNATQPVQTLLGLPLDEALILIAVLIIVVIGVIAYVMRPSGQGEEPPTQDPRYTGSGSAYVSQVGENQESTDTGWPPPEESEPAAPVVVTSISESKVEPVMRKPKTTTFLSTTHVPALYKCPACHAAMTANLKCNACGSSWTPEQVPDTADEVSSVPTGAGSAKARFVRTSASPPSTDVDHEWEQQMMSISPEPQQAPDEPVQGPPPTEVEEEPHGSVPFLVGLRLRRQERKAKKMRKAAEQSDEGTHYMGLVAFKGEKEGDDEEDGKQK